MKFYLLLAFILSSTTLFSQHKTGEYKLSKQEFMSLSVDSITLESIINTNGNKEKLTALFGTPTNYKNPVKNYHYYEFDGLKISFNDSNPNKTVRLYELTITGITHSIEINGVTAKVGEHYESLIPEGEEYLKIMPGIGNFDGEQTSPVIYRKEREKGAPLFGGDDHWNVLIIDIVRSNGLVKRISFK